MNRILFPMLPAAVVLVAPPAAAVDPQGLAAPAHVHAYAIVAGSNAAGAGQQALHFAEDDAMRVVNVLRELGRFEPRDVHILLHPSPADVVGVIDEVTAAVRAGDARGEQAELVFYYSGHAKATAVTLGADDLPLAKLREKLVGVPAALTVVILDACQSGAFARVKGAEPAADFTYNSVSKLTQRGLVVMASSSQEELSQESDELHGSYFTHHLVTALRGAGDADGDGRVSLDEAYRYAYRRTLASTARTQVGEQHVTLDIDLAGHGDVPLTYPIEARARLELPAALEGRVLLQLLPSNAVVAEVQKAPGSAVDLALSAGSYDAIIGRSTGIVQCHLALADDRLTPLDTSHCAPVVADRSEAKGESFAESQMREIDRWAIEGAVGAMTRQDDALTSRLGTFDYTEREPAAAFDRARIALAASRILASHVAAVFQVSTLAADSFQRSIAGSTDIASFATYGAAIAVRVSTDERGRLFGVYGQAGAGVSLGTLTYETHQGFAAPSSTDVYASYWLSGALGGTIRFRRVPLTLFAQGGFDRAPAIHDRIGDTHDSGGFSGMLGLRWRLGGGP